MAGVFGRDGGVACLGLKDDGGRLDVLGLAVDRDGEDNGADGDLVARLEQCFLDAVIIMEGAVGGAEIAELYGVAIDGDFAVLPGDGGKGNAQVACVFAADDYAPTCDGKIPPVPVSFEHHQ